MERIISVDIKADLGFLKKPDINESIYLTYNMLHKPALLGILGAIAGLAGYQNNDELPEHYLKLKSLKVAICPLSAERGNFQKTVIQYNNSVGYASHEEGGNLIIVEQILIKPNFRCYLLLADDNPLHEIIQVSLQRQEGEFLPYFGKNEFSLWWENYQEYNYQPFQFDSRFRISTIFMKGKQIVKEIVIKRPPPLFSKSDYEPEFAYFEELPVGFDEQLLQYQKELFVFSNFKLPKEARIENLYQLNDSDEIIQLF